MELKYYKVHVLAQDPKFQTKRAACFDLHALIPSNENILIFSGKDAVKVDPLLDTNNNKRYIAIMPGERALIPTGLIFDIPEGYSLRIHPRSGMVLKYGLTLANCEGVVDEDYTQETKVILYNMNVMEAIKIYDGDRIAQAELISYMQPSLIEVNKQPDQKSDRVGGFGSTGKN